MNKPTPKNHREWLKAVLDEIKENKGITIEELETRWPESGNTVRNCVTELESEKMVDVDLLDRCTASKPRYLTRKTTFSLTISYKEDGNISPKEISQRNDFLKKSVRNFLADDLKGSFRNIKISIS